MSKTNVGMLDEDVRREIVAIATSALVTWDMLDDEARSKYKNVAEFTGHMILGTAQEIVDGE